MRNIIILLILALHLVSCKDNAQTQNYHNTEFQKEVNFDHMLQCNDYSYDDGYFLTADYGCIYNPKGNNNFGNIIIYLIPKKKQHILDEQISIETDKINNLSIVEYKKEYKIYLFLIDKKYLNYNKSADPVYYQKTKYMEKAYTFDDKKNKWDLIDSIDIIKENQIDNEQTWRENIISRSIIKKENKEIVSLEKWEGLYLNSDNQQLFSYKDIKDRIGWYELKISPKEIVFNNDTRMESEFPADAPGGFSINYYCDYNIIGTTIRLYEKKENDTSSPKFISEKGQKLVLELTKNGDGDKYYGKSNDILNTENLTNSTRVKSKSPYLFYKFGLDKN